METVTSGGASAGLGYPDSLDSSPRSRGAESWDEPFPSSAAKLRLMCSYGGRIVPRPTDKSLCYLGGETRIVVVDRLSSLAELSARLSRNLLGGRPFTLKYQLPNEDLDSLISVTTDDDLENMIEEYDRIAASNPSGGSTRSSRLRLFLFSSKPESAPSSINSLLDDSKSETWFVDALNGAMGMDMVGIDGLSADAASGNCLLSFEDDSSVHSRGTAPATAPAPPELLPRPGSFGKLARHGLDVQSVPESPMLDNSSSFGSTSSAPSVSNLPPIRVRIDDRPSDHRITTHEDRFPASGQEAPKEAGFAPNPPAPSPPINLPTGPASTSSISPTENPTRVFSSDDDKSDHGVVRKPPPVAYLQKPPPVDAPISDSVTRPTYYQDRPSAATVTAVNPVSNPKPVPDPNYGGYVNVMPQMQPEQLQQQQQQFIRANPHYVHPNTGAVLPAPSYYQMPHPIQQSQQPHMPMYYLPVRSNAPYNLAAAGQPSLGDATVTTIPTSLPKLPAKAELPANMYRTAATTPALQPAPSAPLIHVAADQVHPYGVMGGYHVMHHHHPSQAPAAMANYGYEYADPSQPQMYYTQTTSPPGLAPQYQTAMSAATPAIQVTATAPQMHQGEVKQTRAL